MQCVAGNGFEVSFENYESVLKLDRGESCPFLWTYKNPLNGKF